MIDTIEEKHRTRPIDQGFVDYLKAVRQMWRRVNDAIVWLVLGRSRHVVKRVCLHRERGPLLEANAEHAFSCAQARNAFPDTIAVWNDATSAVDIGDLTIGNVQDRTVSFIELKEGRVNEEIIGLLELRASSEEYERAFSSFIKRRGREGQRQLNRVLRQETRAAQAMSLLQNDRGIDPFSGREIQLMEGAVRDATYDKELSYAIAVARRDGEALVSVDGCLWIYVTCETGVTFADAVSRFGKRLEIASRDAVDPTQGGFGVGERGRAVSLNEGDQLPIALPLFLRAIPPQDIAEIATLGLRNRVLLFLDWAAFGRAAEALHARFRWGGARAGRRERSQPWHLRSSLVVDERIPELVVGEAVASITGANLIQVLFDGLRPATFLEQAVDTWTTLQQQNHDGIN